LLNLYKLGHEKILMFYPALNLSPGEIFTLTPERFKHVIDKHLQSDSCDPYFRKEYSFGFFKQQGMLENYQEYSEIIYSEARALFEQYYAKPALV